jgi:CSLREA domain-containing protein
VGTCDGSTWSCSFRIDDVTFPSAPGNRDPLPAWVTFGLRLSVARYDPSLPEDHRIRLEQFDIDTPVWVVRPPTTGSIEIVKETIPAGDPQAFAFTGLGDFSLDTDPGTQLPNRRTFSDLEIGGRVIRELPTPGWQLVSIDCNDPTGTTVQLDTATATVDLAAGDVVTCTFRNRKTAGTALVVNSTADTADAHPGDGFCDTGATISRNGTPESECTLRAAIREAARTGADAISFDVPGSGVPRIVPASPLPDLADETAVDGSTQPGGWVEVSGVDAGDGANGLTLEGGGSSVRGLVVNGFDGTGIVLAGEGGHAVAGNRIGTNNAGTAAVPNGAGVAGRVPGNVIGGRTAGARGEPCTGDCNLVSGNRADGVFLSLGENRIQGNFVGVDLTGTRALGNGGIGIGGGTDPAEGGDPETFTIGGPTTAVGTAPGNLVAGNGGWNIRCDGCMVQGNLVGTVVTGRSALGGGGGIMVGLASLVGPRLAHPWQETVSPQLRPEGNVVSGHHGQAESTCHGQGIGICSSEEDRVNGNFVGTTLDGLEPLGNGVGLSGMAGGPAAFANVVSGNDVGVVGRRASFDVGVRSGGFLELGGNFIGTNARGDAAVPNRIGVDGDGGSIGIDPASGAGRPQGSTSCTAPCNLVSGNVEVGLHLQSGRLAGNFIGTDRSGTRALPNGVGVLMAANDSGDPVSRSRIGGASGAATGACDRACNLISGNVGVGIAFVDEESWSVPASYGPHRVEGNAIGVAADGSPLPNGGDGIRVTGLIATIPAGAGPALVIGGDGEAGNRIAGNGAAGILLQAVTGAIPRQVTVVGNSTDGNGGLGLDLVTPGDPPGPSLTGLSTWQGMPTVESVVRNADGSVTLSGSVSAAGLDSERVDVYLVPACDSTGYGEGARWAGVTASSALTGSFSITVPSVPVGTWLTATATDGDGSTSEFSHCARSDTPGETALTSPAPAGTTRLQIASSDGLVGKVVEIGTGATAERNYGLAPGSLILVRPTRFAHAAGEPVRAVDDTLFVSVDRATITRSSRLPDIALLTGVLRPVAGRAVACGEDVTLTLDGSTVAQRVPGTRFVRQKNNRCVFVAKVENGIGRLELDLGKGTWNAQVVRRDLERLTNPIEASLTIGDDTGAETLGFRETKAVWTYVR